MIAEWIQILSAPDDPIQATLLILPLVEMFVMSHLESRVPF